MNAIYLRHSFLNSVLGNELVDHHLVLLSEAVSTRKGLKFKYSGGSNTEHVPISDGRQRSNHGPDHSKTELC